MNNYYGTFGIGQKNENCFAKIQANSKEEARTKMFQCFGTTWAFMYDEAQWYNEEGISQDEEYGLNEILVNYLKK